MAWLAIGLIGTGVWVYLYLVGAVGRRVERQQHAQDRRITRTQNELWREEMRSDNDSK